MGSQSRNVVPDKLQMFTGLQAILDGTISDPQSKSITDAIFVTAISMLQLAQNVNCSAR